MDRMIDSLPPSSSNGRNTGSAAAPFSAGSSNTSSS